MMVINIPLVIYGICIRTIRVIEFEWTSPASVAENIASLQLVFARARADLDTTSQGYAASVMRMLIIVPLLSFSVFAWFGFEAEARKVYGEALLKLGRMIGVMPRERGPHVSTLCLPWSAGALWKAKFRQGLVDASFLVLPNAPQSIPRPYGVPPHDGPELPTSHVRIAPSYPAGNRLDTKRQGKMPSRKPAPRLSIHKPLLAALNPANTIPSTLDVPLRPLSHHKPRLGDLAPPNAPVIATHAASGSGSSPPYEKATNNIRRQEKFTSRPRACRLSVHKPAFVPLAPANPNSAIPDASGSTSVVEDNMAPPPPWTTPRTPPPLSTPLTATPAPPYRDVNPFLSHVP
jgi:hypothetical protein